MADRVWRMSTAASPVPSTKEGSSSRGRISTGSSGRGRNPEAGRAIAGAPGRARAPAKTRTLASQRVTSDWAVRLSRNPLIAPRVGPGLRYRRTAGGLRQVRCGLHPWHPIGEYLEPDDLRRHRRVEDLISEIEDASPREDLRDRVGVHLLASLEVVRHPALVEERIELRVADVPEIVGPLRDVERVHVRVRVDPATSRILRHRGLSLHARL